MATLKRRIAVAVTVGVWVTAIGSATALAYVLNRPLEPRVVVAELGPPRALQPVPEHFTNYPSASEQTLAIPPITIVARAHRPLRAAPDVATEHARDISEMNCVESRALDMGSGRVQVCQ